MPNYATTTLLEERVTSARLTNLCRGLAGADRTAMLTNAIERAEALVDGYLATRYSVPVAANALAEEWTLAIAEYEIYKRGTPNDVPQKIRDSYTDVLALLKDVAAGKLDIPVSTAALGSTGSSMAVSSDASRYDEDSMENY